MINELGEWRNDTWHWNLVWRRNFYDWKIGQLNSMMGALSMVQIKIDLVDEWKWKNNDLCPYYVRVAYKLLYNYSLGEE